MDAVIASFNDIYAQNPIGACVIGVATVATVMTGYKNYSGGDSGRPKRAAASKSASTPAATPSRKSRRLTGGSPSPVELRRPRGSRRENASETVFRPTRRPSASRAGAAA